MKIYTKTGDKGETGLLGGERIGKDSIRINAYGTVDECNSVIGIIRADDIDEELDTMLEWVQNQLFIVGADLATPGDKQPKIPRIAEKEIKQLEKHIDRMEKSLPPLKNFILPGGAGAGAFLHLARTVCRRAERSAVALLRDDPAAATAAIFLNRLSDFFFVAARWVNHQAGIPDHKWDSPRRKKSGKSEQ